MTGWLGNPYSQQIVSSLAKGDIGAGHSAIHRHLCVGFAELHYPRPLVFEPRQTQAWRASPGSENQCRQTTTRVVITGPHLNRQALASFRLQRTHCDTRWPVTHRSAFLEANFRWQVTHGIARNGVDYVIAVGISRDMEGFALILQVPDNLAAIVTGYIHCEHTPVTTRLEVCGLSLIKFAAGKPDNPISRTH